MSAPGATILDYMQSSGGDPVSLDTLITSVGRELYGDASYDRKQSRISAVMNRLTKNPKTCVEKVQRGVWRYHGNATRRRTRQRVTNQPPRRNVPSEGLRPGDLLEVVALTAKGLLVADENGAFYSAKRLVEADQ